MIYKNYDAVVIRLNKSIYWNGSFTKKVIHSVLYLKQLFLKQMGLGIENFIKYIFFLFLFFYFLCRFYSFCYLLIYFANKLTAYPYRKKKIYIYIYICIYIYTHAIMKTMCPPGYHHSGFVATRVLGHMMYGYIMCPSGPCKWTIHHVSHCGDKQEGTLFSW